MRVEAQNPRHQATQSKSSQSHPVVATKMAARYPVLITRSFTIQRVLRIRLWCEIRLRMPYPAMKPRANTGVINSTSWITKTSRRWGALYRAAVRQKYDDRALIECLDFMHCVETSAFNWHAGATSLRLPSPFHEGEAIPCNARLRICRSFPLAFDRCLYDADFSCLQSNGRGCGHNQI